jgi:hypothetical protein
LFGTTICRAAVYPMKMRSLAGVRILPRRLAIAILRIQLEERERFLAIEGRVGNVPTARR